MSKIYRNTRKLDNVRKGVVQNHKCFHKKEFRVMRTEPCSNLHWPYTFVPTALRPDASKYVLSKVRRRVIHMSRLDFIIENIQCLKNVFADLLTRWSSEHRSMKATCGSIRALYRPLVPSEMEVDDVDLTKIEMRRKSMNHQKKHWCVVRCMEKRDLYLDTKEWRGYQAENTVECSLRKRRTSR